MQLLYNTRRRGGWRINCISRRRLSLVLGISASFTPRRVLRSIATSAVRPLTLAVTLTLTLGSRDVALSLLLGIVAAGLVLLVVAVGLPPAKVST